MQSIRSLMKRFERPTSIQHLIKTHVRNGQYWLVVGPYHFSEDPSAAAVCQQAGTVGARVTFLAPHHPDYGKTQSEKKTDRHHADLRQFHQFLKERGWTEEQFRSMHYAQTGLGNIWKYRENLEIMHAEMRAQGRPGMALPSLRPESALDTALPAGSIQGIYDQGACGWILDGYVPDPRTGWRPPTLSERGNRIRALANRYDDLASAGTIMMLFEKNQLELQQQLADYFRKKGRQVQIVPVNPDSKFTIAQSTYSNIYPYSSALVALPPEKK